MVLVWVNLKEDQWANMTEDGWATMIAYPLVPVIQTEDRWSLTGVFAIVANAHRYKFIEVKFTYNDATYDKTWYTEDDISLGVRGISMLKLEKPTIVLTNIEKVLNG